MNGARLGPISVIAFSGEYDVYRKTEVRDEFTHAGAAPATLVDLLDVDSVDSTFVAELLRFKRRCDDAGTQLAVLAGRSAAGHRLASCGFVEGAELFENRADALAALRTSSA